VANAELEPTENEVGPGLYARRTDRAMPNEVELEVRRMAVVGGREAGESPPAAQSRPFCRPLGDGTGDRAPFSLSRWPSANGATAGRRASLSPCVEGRLMQSCHSLPSSRTQLQPCSARLRRSTSASISSSSPTSAAASVAQSTSAVRRAVHEGGGPRTTACGREPSLEGGRSRSGGRTSR